MRHGAEIVLVACSLIVAAYLPPQETRRTGFYRVSLRDDQQRWIRGEQKGLLLLEARDRVVSALAGGRRTQPAIWADPEFGAAATRRFTDSVRQALLRQPSVPDVPVAIGRILNTYRRNGASQPWFWIWSGPRYILPRKSGDPCLVLIMASQQEAVKPVSLGPCGLYAAFGMPGPAINQWLAGDGALYGLNGVAGTPSWTRARAAQLTAPGGSVLTSYVLRQLDYQYWYDHREGIDCQWGDVARCVDAIHEPKVQGYGWRDDNAVMDRRAGALNPRTALLSYASRGWLGDLARAHGSARFAKFWHSALPLDSAFADAFGVPLGAWTRDWTRDYPQPTPRRVSTLSALLTLLCVGVAVGGGAVFAARRQVET
jgi:hypothetical protein